MSNVTRRTVLSIVGAASLLPRALWSTEPSSGWRLARDDLHNLYSPLTNRVLADCEYLDGVLKIFDARIKALTVTDAAAFRNRVKKQKQALAAADSALQKQIQQADSSFQINSISTVIGAALSLCGLVVSSPVAIGVLAGVSLLSGVGFAAWALIENPDPENGGELLVGYGMDRGVTLVGLMAEHGKTVVPKLLSASMAILGPYLSAQQALKADAKGRRARQQLISLRRRLQTFRREIDQLPADDKTLLETVLRPVYQSTRMALKRFRDETAKTGCLVIRTGPQIRPS